MDHPPEAIGLKGSKLLLEGGPFQNFLGNLCPLVIFQGEGVQNPCLPMVIP